MISVSAAGLVCWISGAFALGIVYGRWHLARALANRAWLDRQECRVEEEDTLEMAADGKEAV